MKALFIGRLEKDLGLDTYFKIIQNLKLQTDFAGDGKLKSTCQKYGRVLGFVDIKKIIKNYDMIFASSYLSILEALIAKKPVFAVYENELKKDYLKITPFYKYISINKIDVDKKYSIEGYNWAKKQTWGKVTDLYIKLWQKYL